MIIAMAKKKLRLPTTAIAQEMTLISFGTLLTLAITFWIQRSGWRKSYFNSRHAFMPCQGLRRFLDTRSLFVYLVSDLRPND